MATWKEKYNKKYGYEKSKSNSLSDIAKDTGISKRGLQQIYNKGIGAYKTNPQSVRPNVTSKEQWAMARVYSAVMGGKASKVDAKELKMQMGGKTEKINWSEYYKQGGLTESIMSDEMQQSLFDENGERKNDLESIEVLTDYVNSLPQTKSIYYNESTQKYSPKRQKLHREIINEFKDDLICVESDEPIAILMGGSPASGKSTFLRKYAPYLLSEELLRIDADEVRSKLPEYEGWNASQTHLETKDIVNTLLSDRTIGLPCEFDLIYDGTMNNTKSYLPLIDLLRKLNYKIFVVYIDNVPKDVIVKRALERYKKSGRFVPLEVIDDFFDKGKSALNEIKEKVDGYMIVDGGSNDYRIIEEKGIKLPQNRVYSQLGYSIDEEQFNRNDFYKGYYERLSPSNFEVKQKGGKIQIDLPIMATSHDGIDEVDAIASGVFEKGGNLDKVIGGIPYKIEGSKAIISTYLPDDTKERIIKRAKVNGYNASPNMGGGVSISLKKFEKGGETDFNPDGKIKDKIVHASGQAGGMLVGKRHSKGGIKAINKSTGQPLEMEGGEVVITRDAVSDNKKRSFNGKMMTNRQILSAINESGGGVSFADGGQVPNDVQFDCNAEYEYGGKTMCGKDLAYALGGVTTAIVTDPNEAMADLQSTYGFGDVYANGGTTDDEIFDNAREELGEEYLENLDKFAEGGQLSPDEFPAKVDVEETKKQIKEPKIYEETFEMKFLKDKIQNMRKIYNLKKANLSELEKGIELRKIRRFEIKLDELKLEQKSFDDILDSIIDSSLVEFGNMDIERKLTKSKSINGKTSELTKKEQEAVKTQSFIDWFGDWQLAYENNNYEGVSKIINPTTKEPLVVYHGTNKKFVSWETYTENNLHYFSKKKEFATWFAEYSSFRGDDAFIKGEDIKKDNFTDGTYVYSCFLDIKNPIDFAPFGVEAVPFNKLLEYVTVKYDIDLSKIKGYENYKNLTTKVYTWRLIRQWQNFNLYIRNNTPFDGFSFYEYIPDSQKRGFEDASLCFTAFNSNQIKFTTNNSFTKQSADSRLEVGGLIF